MIKSLSPSTYSLDTPPAPIADTECEATSPEKAEEGNHFVQQTEGRHLSKTWCPLTPPHTRTELPKRTALWPCL